MSSSYPFILSLVTAAAMHKTLFYSIVALKFSVLSSLFYLVPKKAKYAHSHGSENIVFCELDWPRSDRNVIVQVVWR